MTPEIDYAGLKEAMNQYAPFDEFLYYLDTETGDVLVIDEWTEKQAYELPNPDQAATPEIRLAWYLLWDDGEPIGPELSEVEEEAMYERVEAFLDRYIGVPTADSSESYQDMVDFAGTASSPHLRELLEVALQGKGAFRRFKDVLWDYPQERDRWFEFKDRRLEERVDRWLRIHGLLPAEEEPEGQEGPEEAGEQGTRRVRGRGIARTEEPGEMAFGEAAGITILNFAHPLTPAQRQQIKELTGEPIGHIIDAPVQLDDGQPFEPQIRRHIDELKLASDALQAGGLSAEAQAGLSAEAQAGLSAEAQAGLSAEAQAGVLVNPPGYAPATAVLLAELHGRIGRFPAIVRIRPVAGSSPTRYEVAEIINLQAIRERSREER